MKYGPFYFNEEHIKTLACTLLQSSCLSLFTGVYVNHGHRGMIDSLAETQEYIDVLKEALDVAFEVQKYCILNGWWAK